jgi:4-hydroxybenzoate polyprenyltransferase
MTTGGRAATRPARSRATAAAALVRCSHPEPVVAVSAILGVLALASGRGWGTAWVVLAIMAGQLFVGWSNDYLDAGLDRSRGRPDKPLANGQVSGTTVRTAAAAALLACVPLSLASGVAPALVHGVGLAAATLYNLGLKRTAASVLPYALAFGLLPAFVSLGLPDRHWPPLWATVAAALLGAGGHFTQTLPDIEAERASGTAAGLPHLAGPFGSALAAAGLLAAAELAVAFGPGAPGPAALAALAACLALAAGIVAAAAARKFKLAFRLTLLAAAVAGAGFALSGRAL